MTIPRWLYWLLNDHSGPGRTASLKVVHSHGPCHQPNQAESITPSLLEVLSQDQSRVSSIQARHAFNTNQNRLLDAEVTLPGKSGISFGTGDYIVTVGLGTPKKDFSLIFDTGSDLTWTQCQPCVGSCYKQRDSIYDPAKSSTYSNISCTSAQCNQLRSATGNSPACTTSTCVYGIGYGDGSFSTGFFGKDKLTLSATDVFDEFLFGCGQKNTGFFGSSAGLIGLGRNPLSLVSQTAQKYSKFFSYCLPTVSGSNGHLTFGKEAVPSSVKFTPLITSDEFYFVNIEGIGVAGRKLPIEPFVFQASGTIVDSGTVITRLPSIAYSALRAAFRQQMVQYKSAPALSFLDTCYDLSNQTTVKIPAISFYFNGNVTVDLDTTGTLIAADASQVCLAFAETSGSIRVGIFGNRQQQTLEVVYDVDGGKLGFGAGGCS